MQSEHNPRAYYQGKSAGKVLMLGLKGESLTLTFYSEG